MKKKKGISLLEIVITLAILSIVGVAISNMVMLSIKTTQSAKSIMDENTFFSNARESVEGVKKLSEVKLNLELSNTIDKSSTINDKLTADYIKENIQQEDTSKYEIKLFKLEDESMALKLQIDKESKNSGVKKALSKDELSEYDASIGEVNKTLVCLSYVDKSVTPNVVKWKYILGNSDEIEKMEEEEIKALSGLEEGKDILKIFFENNSSNNLKILTYSLSEPNNQSIANINIILENKTKYLDDAKVAPTYELKNYSYDQNFNIITRTKIEDEYIKELGDKLEYTLEIVRYEKIGNDYTFESSNKLVGGYVPVAITK